MRLPAMTEPETVTYKTVGSLEVRADVLRRTTGSSQPAILWIHGGALIMGSRAKLPPPALLDRLLDRYIVVSIDYRLAPETQLDGILQDVDDAYAWLMSRGTELFGADSARIAVSGMSAGGYLALTTGYRVQPKPKAIVSFYGYGDLTGAWYSQPSQFYSEHYPAVSREEASKAVSGPPVSGAPDGPAMQGRPEFYLYCRQNGLWPQSVSGHDPAADAAWFAQYEPLRNVTRSFPPTLFLHGVKDTDVPFEQSILMKRELVRNGVACELVSHPDWGHAFDLEQNAPDLPETFDKVLAFFAAHIGQG
jgi:acetyl esterase/lipase